MRGRRLPADYLFLNCLRCHDDIGWGLDYDYLSGFGMSEVAHKRFLNDYFTGKFDGSPSRSELYNDDESLGDNVWIGAGAIIVPGVHTGRNTVIGAGSVVTKDIPENVLAVGNPVRVIKTIKE